MAWSVCRKYDSILGSRLYINALEYCFNGLSKHERKTSVRTSRAYELDSLGIAVDSHNKASDKCVSLKG